MERLLLSAGLGNSPSRVNHVYQYDFPTHNSIRTTDTVPDLARSARPTFRLQAFTILVCALTMVGCASWFGREPIIENKLVTHYNNLAASIAQLDPAVQSPEPAPTLGPGRELVAPKPEDRYPITLAEAIRMAIENNKIIRQNAQFMSPNNPVMQSPDSVPSVLDPAIQNSGVLFGSRGTKAALSDFDPRLTVTNKWGNDQTVSNTTILAPPNQTLENNYMQYQSRLEQQLLSGGVFSINQNWNYGLSNQPAQLFNSAYTGILGAEYRQPLWAGSGKEYTAVAGPATQRARGFSNVSQGIVIAHINKRLSEIDLQENLQNLVREVGDLYWDLYQSYQDYEYDRSTARVSKDLWDTMTSRTYQESGVDLAQAEDAYYDAKGREELSLSNLFQTEAKLRRMLGLPLDDSRMLFPCDQPREDELHFNRAMCLYEGLCNRIELTRQKTSLHSYQLQLTAAKKLVAPKLDFVSGYALNGFGHNFISSNSDNFNSATSNLFSGKQTSWSAGFEYSIPLWLRQEKAQVEQLELKVLKAKKALATQEDEIAHELNSVLMTVKRSQSMSSIYRQRVQAARKRVLLAKSAFDGGYKNSDQLLRALNSQTQAQSVYVKSITEYNKSLRDLLYRTGRLLPADGISVIGVDGLPLMSPSNPELPFDGLRHPSEPHLLEPELPSPSPPDKPDEKPDSKPKKKTPVADFGSESLSSSEVFETPRIADETDMEPYDESDIVIPVKYVEEAERPMGSNDDFAEPVIIVPEISE